MKKLLRKFAPVIVFIVVYLLAGCGVTGHPYPVPVPNAPAVVQT